MIVDYHRANYFGENFIICGGGGIDHNELCAHVDRYFGKLPREPVLNPNRPGKPELKSEVFLMESELTPNINVGIFYEGA